jgi:heme/copper-type cytochrome/quinol oxidase subunit 3
MSGQPAIRIVGDLSTLPDAAMGPRSLVWWGTFGFMLIEGTGFLLAAGAYLYLVGQSAAWPPGGDRPPDLAAGILFLVLLLASEIPNRWVAAKAKAHDARAVRIGMVAMALIGLVLLAIRGLEFAHLNVRWDTDAYGSVLWLLVFLHATHVLTDLADTVVLGACVLTHEITDSQFADVNDNASYWSFVVVTWLPLYALVYWAPRLL